MSSGQRRGRKSRPGLRCDRGSGREGQNAVDIAQAAAQVLGGGRGRGRPDLAQAGGANPDKLEEAFDAAREVIRENAE
ncbi:MAG: DHHA1 domain-containing protein [Planctomycetota bacterium]